MQFSHFLNTEIGYLSQSPAFLLILISCSNKFYLAWYRIKQLDSKTFVPAFDHGGNHLELFVGMKLQFRVGRNDNSLTKT